MPSPKGKLKVCSRGHQFYKSSDCPACPICWPGQMKKLIAEGLPSIGAPAMRALDHAGISTLKQVSKHTKNELLSMHGVGPKAIDILQKELKKKGLSFKKL